jgi:hypothetical protein
MGLVMARKKANQPSEEPEENFEYDQDELDRMHDVMDAGLNPGAFQQKNSGAVWSPGGGVNNLKKGGIQEHLLNKRNPGQITDEELEEFIVEFEADPAGQTKKQLYRMLVSTKTHINDLYGSLNISTVGTRQAEAIQKQIKEATEILLEITKALRLQPQQNKDDGDMNNVATIAEMVDIYKIDKLKKGIEENVRLDRELENDIYGFKEIKEAQVKKMRDQDNPDKD